MLKLRPYKKCDAKYIVSWTKDEVAFRKWCADRYDKYPIRAEDINEPAYYCYKSVGFKDVQLKEYEYYHVIGENWKCLELEMENDM